MVDQEKDTRWKNAGKKVGLQVWRVEKYKVLPWNEDQYGHFFTDHCYVVLKTNPHPKDPKKFLYVLVAAARVPAFADVGVCCAVTAHRYDAHFWVGFNSSQDEYATAAFMTLELDDHLAGAVVQHREIQNGESPLFLTYFKTITFHDSAVDSLYAKVGPKDYKARLLHLRGTKNVIMREVPIKIESLNSGDVFILDNGLDIYTMLGVSSGGMERARATELTRKIVEERGGSPIQHVFKEEDDNDDSKAFWAFFGGKAPIAPADPADNVDHPKRLFRLTDETGRMLFKEIKPFTRESLDTKDAFILDSGDRIMIWVGANTSDDEKKQALPYAVDYMFKNKRPKDTPVSRFKEGSEADYFWAGFPAS
jgi:gelsolin